MTNEMIANKKIQLPKQNTKTALLTREPPSFVCKECLRKIDSVDDLNLVNGKSYHYNCLRCDRCEKKFANPIDMRQSNENLLCKICESGDVACASCKKKVTPAENQTDNVGHFYHKNCFLCALCREPVTPTDSCHIVDKVFHKECLRCERCMEHLTIATVHDLNKRIYCRNCHDKMSYPTCKKCKKLITNDRVSTEENLTYHTKCYVCSKCNKQLRPSEKTYRTPISGNMCADCYQKYSMTRLNVPSDENLFYCRKCNKGTTRPHITKASNQMRCRRCRAYTIIPEDKLREYHARKSFKKSHSRTQSTSDSVTEPSVSEYDEYSSPQGLIKNRSSNTDSDMKRKKKSKKS